VLPGSYVSLVQDLVRDWDTQFGSYARAARAFEGGAVMEHMIDGLRSALETLVSNGFDLPFHVAAISVNGSFLTATYVPGEDGLDEQIHGLHSAGDFKTPVNVVLVDSRGEAARDMIGEPGSATVLQ
jgi:hypothetical protein